MITLKRAVLLVSLLGAFNYGKSQKIAHLNFDSLVSMMAETKIATEVAQNYFKGLEQESIAMQTELENKYKDYMAGEATMSEMVKKNKQEDLQQLQARIQDFQRQAEMDYKKKQAEITAPIYEKAKKAIDAVAKENSFKYVLDTSPQNSSVLYSETSEDVLMLVKKKLDTMPMATIPGATPPGTSGIKPAPAPANNQKPNPSKAGK